MPASTPDHERSTYPSIRLAATLAALIVLTVVAWIGAGGLAIAALRTGKYFMATPALALAVGLTVAAGVTGLRIGQLRILATAHDWVIQLGGGQREVVDTLISVGAAIGQLRREGTEELAALAREVEQMSARLAVIERAVGTGAAGGAPTQAQASQVFELGRRMGRREIANGTPN